MSVPTAQSVLAEDSAMQAGHPSRTALGAARHRAAHQVLERGFIFSDPFALPILGIGADAVVQDTQGDEFTRKLRLFIAIRSRLAEDALAMAVARGVRQLVILGAGLDTYAYRNPFGNTLRIFEVDYPATQVWKREKLAAMPIRRNRRPEPRALGAEPWPTGLQPPARNSRALLTPIHSSPNFALSDFERLRISAHHRWSRGSSPTET
jgi:O-methyltransferase involved in polyketide biosynthesis